MFFLFDIGGTKTRFGISADGTTLSSTFIFPTPKNREAIIPTWKSALVSLGVKNIESAIGGIAGILEGEEKTLVKSPMIPDWEGLHLQDFLGKFLGTTVDIYNDAALAGLGEAVFGAGKREKTVMYITVSTGVGGARIVEGDIDVFAQGFEPGHQIIALEGEEYLELEGLISGTALRKKYGVSAEEIHDPAIWEKVYKFLSVGVLNSIVHWSPDCVVMGGSVFLGKLNATVLEMNLQQISHIFPHLPKIYSAQLGDMGALYGALAIAEKQKKSTQNNEKRV